MVKTSFKLTIFLSLLLLGTFAWAQGQLTLYADDRIEEGLNQYIESIDTSELAGYRVQVYFGSNKYEADKAKQTVLEACPNLNDKVYIIYQSPNYKVRVGNFEREVDAQSTLRVLGEVFPNVFVVRDRIEMFRELLSCD